MNSKDTYNRFQELNKDNKIKCTALELEDFLSSGLLFKSGKTYLNRNNQKIKIDLIETKTYNMSINLQNLISICEEKSKNKHIKRIYCISESCYNKYKEMGLIISKGSDEYYRFFESELWLLYKL